ncbi:hypothetical protein UF75_0117 [Desulfosporosinus sp. I2]|uniref:hypothetical protein n=1 Tax=Desulfosporosinus sp. I2 TaxID=1617025 RepID=UPI0005EF9931|nr:hypothetical protein [Desulfosporosinus sp. I2]KJR49563.1 hypothetical protein UF75_0117 [Desulfosporosinus sp. I2]
MIQVEKMPQANRQEHQQLIKRMTKIIRLKGIAPLYNQYIDLFASVLGVSYVFEMKSLVANK